MAGRGGGEGVAHSLQSHTKDSVFLAMKQGRADLERAFRNKSRPNQILVSCEKRGKMHVITRAQPSETAQAV